MFFRRFWPRGSFVPRDLQTLLSGSFWVLLAGLFGQGGMLICSLLVANLLGAASYGHYALVQSTIVLLAGLAQISFGMIIAQQVASYREHRPEMAGEIAAFCFAVTFAISLLLAAALVVGRDLVSSQVFRDRSLAAGLVAAALALPFVAGASIQQGLFGGLERFREQAVISVILVPVVIGLPPLGALYGGFEGAAGALALAYFLRFAVTQLVVVRVFRRAGLRWAWGGFRAKLGLVWRLALPATLSGILVSFAIWGGQTLLMRSGGGAPALGMFAAAYMVKTMVLFAPSQMIVVLLPLLSRIHTLPATTDRHRLVWFNTAASFLMTAVLAAAGIFAAPQVMSLFGEEFTRGGDVLIILLIAAPIEAITISLYQDIQAKGLFWKGFLAVSVPLSATVILLACFLTTEWQGQGLAAAWLAAWLVGLVGTLAARRSLRLGPSKGALGEAGVVLPANQSFGAATTDR